MGHKILVVSLVGLALLLPVSFFVGKHSHHPVIDFNKIEDIVKRHSGPTFGPDAYEETCKRAVGDYFKDHPVASANESILGKIEDIIKKVVKDVVRDTMKEFQDVKDDVTGKDHCKFEWRKDSYQPTLWLYGYEKDGVFWYSYYMYTGNAVNKCDNWKCAK